MNEMSLSSVYDIPDIAGKRVLVRVSLDVPIHDGVVQNHFRIVRALPTISFLLERGAKVIILTHIGRDPLNTVSPLFDALTTHIPLTYIPEVTGDAVAQAIANMADSTALLLENVRSRREEEINDQTFAETLASYADFYVNDAFAVSHRAHASIVGIPQYIPSYAGITFMEEYEALSKAFNPESPSLFILGGAKFETKAPLIEAYATQYTHTFIGGALANDFLKGKGYEVGESLLSPINLETSPLILQENILTPLDVLAVSDDTSREVPCDGVLPNEKILDVGSQSIEMLAPHINEAKTILWNGPLGYYEGGYDTATKRCAKLVAESNAFSIVGGGDTVAAIESLGLAGSFGFLSTAGGAMLEFLEKHTLPGIEALTKTTL
jgi:phosphoglycerate kinase